MDHIMSQLNAAVATKKTKPFFWDMLMECHKCVTEGHYLCFIPKERSLMLNLSRIWGTSVWGTSAAFSGRWSSEQPNQPNNKLKKP